jgi:spore germination cell wall hydrolase CwlJ-like protein
MFRGETFMVGHKSPALTRQLTPEAKEGFVMKQYLAVFLCFFFILVNPAEAAITNDKEEQMQENNLLAQITENKVGKINVNGGKGEIIKKTNLDNEADGTENPKSRKTAGYYSPADLDLLARLVHAEAKGEPYQGKVAVAATVLNRVKDPRYPDTIPGVIYEYNSGFQYCPVSNGQINCPADRQSVQAVVEAFQGNDPTSGALSFYNPTKSFNYWISSKPCLAAIGNHLFVK